MAVLLQISDTHFGTERPVVVEALVELVHRQAPSVLVLSGDITQRALPEEFQAARAFVDRLRVPRVLAVPGNHDIPLFNLVQRFFTPYARHRRAFGNELEPAFESEGLLLLSVNTTRRYRHKNGEVSARQIERVSKRLRNAHSAQLRVIVTHQPVAVTRTCDEHDLLRGHGLAVREWAQAGADLVLGGHIHLPFMMPLHVKHPGLARRMWALQAGTALSIRLRHGTGNSINLIRYAAVPSSGQRSAVVERWDYAEGLQRFEQVSTEALTFSPSVDTT